VGVAVGVGVDVGVEVGVAVGVGVRVGVCVAVGVTVGGGVEDTVGGGGGAAGAQLARAAPTLHRSRSRLRVRRDLFTMLLLPPPLLSPPVGWTFDGSYNRWRELSTRGAARQLDH
jgi:hypothetical protein